MSHVGWSHTPPGVPTYAAKQASEKMRKLQRMHALLTPGKKLRPRNTPEAWAPGQPINTWPPTPVPAVSPVVSTILLSTYTGSSLCFDSDGSSHVVMNPGEDNMDPEAPWRKDVPAVTGEERRAVRLLADSAHQLCGGPKQPGECVISRLNGSIAHRNRHVTCLL